MIQYRLDVQHPVSTQQWSVEWFTTKDEARVEFLKAHGNGADATVCRTDVPTDKAGLAEAMNLAGANLTNWPWPVEEVFSTRKQALKEARTR